MKTCCLLLLLAAALRSPSAGAQALRGTFYSLNPSWTQEQFEFNGNRFVYQVSDCQGETVATGTFVMSADRLVLYCDKAADTTSAPAVFSCIATGKQPTFCFRAIDKLTELPLAGVQISSCSSPRIGTATNAAGEARLTYSPPPGDSLRISRFFCRTRHLALRSPTTQSFTLALDAYQHFPFGDTLTFRIKDVRANSFAYMRYRNHNDETDTSRQYSYCAQAVAEKPKRHK